jgi:hypothetical protein
MPTATDDTSALLSEVKLCEISDVRRTRRREWANRDHVRKARNRGRYGELDAAETAAFRVLVAELGYEDAALVWTDIRPSLADVPLEKPLLVVVNLQLKSAVLAKNPRQIGDLVLSGHPFRVVRLTEAVREVRVAYRRISNAKLAAKALQLPG